MKNPILLIFLPLFLSSTVLLSQDILPPDVLESPACIDVNNGSIWVDLSSTLEYFSLPFEGEYENETKNEYGEFMITENPFTVEDLYGGEYELTIFMDDVSSISFCAEVEEVDSPTFTIDITHASGIDYGDGAITLNPDGQYEYLWAYDPAHNSPTLTHLDPGEYCVTVTDGPCDEIRCITILSDPDEDLVLGAYVNVFPSCDQPIGGADVIMINGTAPYSYLWNTGETSSSIQNVSAGPNGVKIVDANGLSTYITFEIPFEPFFF